MEKLKQYIYSSTAARPITDLDIRALVKSAAQFNSERELTGVLLFNNGTFIQIIEGPEDAIQTVIKRIKRSTMHSNMNELCYHDIKTREFPEWSMAYKSAEDPEIKERYLQLQAMQTDVIGQHTMAMGLLRFVANDSST